MLFVYRNVIDEEAHPRSLFALSMRNRQLKIALATSRDWSTLATGDRRVVSALRARGHDAVAAVWSENGTWPYDATVIRSCWDYHREPQRFRKWLAGASAAGPLWNRAADVLWNMNKRYLLELSRDAIPVPPTLYLESGAVTDETFEILGAERLVVKPAISASAQGVRVVVRRDAPLAVFAPTLVQPFIDEVVGNGELSVVAIDGQPAHAVLKRAATGDFRVQADYGGTAELVPLTPQLRRFAERVLARVPVAPLYARVDFVEGRDGPLLMELELIEPELFFDLAPESAERMAAAIETRIGRRR